MRATQRYQRAIYYVIHLRARGHGQFPFYMLGYDSAYPSSAADVAAMLDQFAEGDRIVHLTRHAPSRDTPATYQRWADFGWQVEAAATPFPAVPR